MFLSDKSLLSAPGRWKCSRGFGVHSPFAFSFIRDTLRERRYSFYAYSSIGDAPAVRLWYRIAWRLQPPTVAVRGVCDTGLRRALVEAACLAVADCADLSETDSGAALTWWGPGTAPSVAEGETAVLVGHTGPSVARVFDSLRCGMCFANAGDIAVIVAHGHLPHQRYDLYF